MYLDDKPLSISFPILQVCQDLFAYACHRVVLSSESVMLCIQWCRLQIIVSVFRQENALYCTANMIVKGVSGCDVLILFFVLIFSSLAFFAVYFFFLLVFFV